MQATAASVPTMVYGGLRELELQSTSHRPPIDHGEHEESKTSANI